MKRIALIFALFAPLLLWTAPLLAGSEQGGLCSNGIDDDGDGLVDCADRDCRQECANSGGGGGGGTTFHAAGAVGHALNCLPCLDQTCVDGDFFDVGTVQDGCGPLSCSSSAGNSLVCGGTENPTPRVDISGLYGLWEGGGQGDPSQCFGNGIVVANVQGVDKSGDGQIQVSLFLHDEVDGTLPGRCQGATDLVTYDLTIDGCSTSDAYPPAPGDLATVSCPVGTLVDIRTEGGGAIAKKCGCTANGPLVRGVELSFLGD